MAGAESLFVCDGCTLLGGIVRAEAEVKSNGDTSLRAEMSLANYVLAKRALDNAAESIDCRALPKDLSPLPSVMPEAGTPEAIALATACPAFDGYISNVNEAAQARAE